MARIDKQLQREISLLLRQRVKKEAVRDAIITGVECSRDLERARVFFTSVTPEGRAALLDALQSVRGIVRALLGQVVKLRRIPALEFVVDESADYGARIDGILDRLGMPLALAPDSDLDADADWEDDDEDA